ncbi:hypothetical protein F4861DRAFT_541605 [Xylaria intraflava]|nr:hypothetical protein F4861DRAFT_541605 [Xylaria intraflava]
MSRTTSDVAAQHLVRPGRQSLESAGIEPGYPIRFSDGALLTPEDANNVLEQLARIFSAVQSAKLPGGPWGSYAEYWVAKLEAQLSEADSSSLLRGWVNRGAQEQIDGFLKSGGVYEVLAHIDVTQRPLIHGDLTLNNVLFDPSTKRITGLLDFDWAGVTNPCEEFLFGLWDVGGGLDERNKKVQPMVLAGHFDARPEGLFNEELRG